MTLSKYWITIGYKINTRRPTIASCLLLLLFIALQLFSVETKAEHWKELAPGIEYQDLSPSILSFWSHIHAFRINLKNNQLDLIMAHDLSQRLASVSEFAKHSNALIAINGGFFDQNDNPLGLRIGHQQQYSPVKGISWWGIFYIKQHKAYLTNVHAFHPEKLIDFAIQSGPRLLVNGKRLSLKQGYSERTALGITKNGQVIILVTDNAPMSTTMLAELMREPPLNCKNALNLDGGGSSQLSAHIGDFNLSAKGFANISDSIIVKPYTISIE